MAVSSTQSASPKRLTGRQKAAVLLIAMGEEHSSRLFQHLDEDEVEQLTYEIANTRNVDPETREMVIREFAELVMAQEYISRGGIEYARAVLENAFGPEKARMVIERLTASLRVRPFDFARRANPSQLFDFIRKEHPQTIAVIMAYLTPEQAGTILSALPPERQVEVAQRLATLDRISPEVLREIEHALEERLSGLVGDEMTAAGGIDAAVAVLNRVDRSTEKRILETLEQTDPDLAEEIRSKMFVFEDLILLDDRSMQRVIREVQSSDWALALKTASEEVSQRVFRNMSKRAGEMLREEMEYLGPVRLRDVEEAQQRIVAVVRQLEEAGEIVVSRGGEDQVVV